MNAQDLLSLHAVANELGTQVHVVETLLGDMQPALLGLYSGTQVEQLRTKLARNPHLKTCRPRPTVSTLQGIPDIHNALHLEGDVHFRF